MCSSGHCLLCLPNFQMKNGQCVKCLDTEGFDPITKECFTGMSLSEFSDTQFGNLKTTATNIDLLNNYFLVTYRFGIDPKTYTHNGFVLFANNVENYNRMMDFCWDSVCTQSTQGIYFALANTKQSLTVERFIVGNTSAYTVSPKSLVFGLKTSDMMDPTTKKYKNFDCNLFGDFYFQSSTQYFGVCQKQCDNGYYKNVEAHRCIKCAENCASCIGPGGCSTCNKKSTLINGECLPCQSPCTSCDQSPNRCLSCTSEGMFNSATFACNKLCLDKKGCSKCDINTGKCLVCEDGYEFRSNECVPKSCSLSNCVLCTNDGKICKACLPGYTFTAGICFVCNTGCTICPSGYQLTNGTCSSIVKKYAGIQLIWAITLTILLIR